VQSAKTAVEPAQFVYDFRQYTFSLALDLGELVWLAGHSASRYSPAAGRIVVTGDLEEQARFALEKIAMILAQAGLGLGDVVKMSQYLTPPALAQRDRLLPVYRDVFGPRLPVISTVPVRSLLRPEALIEIEAVATRESHRRFVWAKDGDPEGPVAVQVAGLVFVRGQHALDADGHVVGTGDLLAQTYHIYQRTGDIWREFGLGWEQVVKTVEFIPPASLPTYRDTAQVRREFLAPVYPAATGIIVPSLAYPEALIEVEFIASVYRKEAVNPGWSRYQRLTYNPAVRAGRYIFLAGQGALNPHTSQVEHEGDVVEQTAMVYRNLGAVLSAAGCNLDALVKTVEFVTPQGLAHYRRTAEVRRSSFRPPYPVATGVVCEALLRPEMLVEVDAMGVLA
jgi:enamine deaminase RidA (YjgF/YER057c/UK114 family)